MPKTSDDEALSDIRPRAFAGMELLLDAIHIARSVINFDLESVIIYYSIAEATMRPLVLGGTAVAETDDGEVPSSRRHGSISRLLIADRTGLPRETVRRKVNLLLHAGLLAEDQPGHVHAVQIIDDPKVQKAASESFAAVRRYDARLRQLGRRGID